MRIGFVTCVQLGLSCMDAFYEAGGQLAVAITLHDEKATKKSGRVFIDSFCQSRDVPLFKINHINDSEVIDLVKKYELDWLFIIGWSQIAGADILAAPRKGVFGMHPTLLPEGRGRAAIPWAILKGLKKTGVTLFKLDEGVDTGPIIDQYEIAISPSTTATDLYQMVNIAHIDLMKKVTGQILTDTVVLKEQDEANATIWLGRTPQDGLINMSGSVWDAERLVRATTRPYPGAFYFKNNRKIIVWAAEFSESVPISKYLEFSDGYLKLIDYEEYASEP